MLQLYTAKDNRTGQPLKLLGQNEPALAETPSGGGRTPWRVRRRPRRRRRRRRQLPRLLGARCPSWSCSRGRCGQVGTRRVARRPPPCRACARVLRHARRRLATAARRADSQRRLDGSAAARQRLGGPAALAALPLSAALRQRVLQGRMQPLDGRTGDFKRRKPSASIASTAREGTHPVAALDHRWMALPPFLAMPSSSHLL